MPAGGAFPESLKVALGTDLTIFMLPAHGLLVPLRAQGAEDRADSAEDGRIGEHVYRPWWRSYGR
jgi:hypothetical protein